MKVAVIGAGAMGSGIAQTFAQCGKVEKVYLCDIKQEFADGGFAKIKKSLDKMVEKGKMEQAAEDAILGKFVCGLSDIAVDPDIVVEAAIENMQIKKDTFKKLQDEIVKNPDCIFASNTSSLSITEIGAGLAKPIIGMHFFNPAPVMKLVEVIAGINTPAEYVEKIVELSKDLGKTPVQVNEAAGFVVNRILIPMINEAINVLNTGVADIEGIDNAMKLGCNHPMGPLELGATTLWARWNSAISSVWTSALRSWMSSSRIRVTTSMRQALCSARWSAARDSASRPVSASMITLPASAIRCLLTRSNSELFIYSDHIITGGSAGVPGIFRGVRI